jgi:cytochrome c5
VNPKNGYSALRLAYYATGQVDDWDQLPEWNPVVETIQDAELDAPGGASTTSLSSVAAPLTLPTSVASIDDPALIALGKAAFDLYPAQLAPYLSVALTSREAASEYGLWTDGARGVSGLVRARMADGSGAVALTCSTCHAAPDARGRIAPGLPNRNLDIGAAVLAAEGYSSAGLASPVAAWGPGRLDVTTTRGTEPARIPDLRDVAWLTYLQQDATIRGADLTTLAIRIETLLITSNDSALRPPRVVALGLAAYVRSLASTLPSADDAAATWPEGAALFASACAACHVAPALTGPPVPLSVIGTDPTLGLSESRGTGTYRVPSLHGVGSRGPLLHDGTIPSVAALFEPARLTPSFKARLHGSGAVPGHPFGLDLPDGDRAALVSYVEDL